MPYIVTTTRPCPACVYGPAGGGEHRPHSVSKRAVATLEEAIETAKDSVNGPFRALVTDALVVVGESGGTVGPLPDGTTIQVEPTDWDTLAFRAGNAIAGRSVGAAQRGRKQAQSSILAAFNARHESGQPQQANA